MRGKKGESGDDLTASTSYQIGGVTFIVEPVFKENSDETITSILIKLIKKDAENA